MWIIMGLRDITSLYTAVVIAAANSAAPVTATLTCRVLEPMAVFRGEYLDRCRGTST